MLFKRFSPPGDDPTVPRFTVCIKNGNAWTTQEWTAAQWRAWLSELTPRELVQHMERWQRYAESMPTMKDGFSFAVSDARQTLRQRECSQAA